MLIKLKRMIENSSFARGVSVLAAGTAVSNLFILLTTPILTRLYTPAEFGVLSVYLAILYTLTVVASLLYEQAIPLPKEEEEAFHLFVLSLVIVFFISVITVIALHLLPFSRWFHTPELKDYFWLVGLSLLGIGWYQACNYWAIRMEEYGIISKSKVNMNTGQMGSQMTLGFFHLGAIGLLIGEMVGRISGFLTFWSLLKKKKLPPLYSVKLKAMKKVMIRYKNFPLISSWSTLINSAGVQMPTFFLAAVYGAEPAGLYLLAQKVLTVPEGLLGHSVTQVYLSKSAQAFRTSPEQFRDLFWQTVKKMALLSLSIITVIVITAPFVISLVFGNEWEGVVRYLQFISVLYFMRMVIEPLTGNFYVLESLNLQLISEVLRFVFICLSLVLSYFFLNSPTDAILCISLFSSLGFLVYGLFAWIAMKKRLSAVQQEVQGVE